MIWLLLGCGGVALLFLYDVADATGRLRPLRLGFAAGCALLLAATAAPVISSLPRLAARPVAAVAGGILSLFFLALLLYTLFFALPFSATYAPGSGPAPLCRTGVYALCRHPGVLWLSLFYFSLWLAAGSPELFAAFLVYTVLDVAYALFQDRWTFVRLFPNYREYRQETPFLLPTAASWRRCFHTLKKGGEAE